MISWNEVRVLEGATAESNAPTSSWARVVRCSKVDLDAAMNSLRSEYVVDGGHVATVEGGSCQTAPGLFAAFAESLAFPAYFGSNGDAFDECLSDLLVLNDGGLGSEFGDRSGIPAKHLVVIISDADLLLGAERDRTQEQRKFIGALQWAASGRARDDLQRGQQLAELIVLSHSMPEAAGTLSRWLSEANVSHLPVLGLGGRCDS